MKKWFVYILECADGTLYTGITNDLLSRIEKHKLGTGAKYTRSRGVKKILHQEIFNTKSKALKREAEIKNLTRSEKLKLL